MYLLDIVYERHRRHSSLSSEGRGALSFASDDRLHSGRNKVAAPDSLSWARRRVTPLDGSNRFQGGAGAHSTEGGKQAAVHLGQRSVVFTRGRTTGSWRSWGGTKVWQSYIMYRVLTPRMENGQEVHARTQSHFGQIRSESMP
jgi:hypothetical protein